MASKRYLAYASSSASFARAFSLHCNSSLSLSIRFDLPGGTRARFRNGIERNWNSRSDSSDSDPRDLSRREKSTAGGESMFGADRRALTALGSIPARALRLDSFQDTRYLRRTFRESRDQRDRRAERKDDPVALSFTSRSR